MSDNIILRKDYRKKFHEYYNLGYPYDKKKEELRKELQSLKNKILNIESGSVKKFYIYKSFVDWDNDRFESELSDLKNNELSLIDPSAFNDPYDCRLPLKLVEDSFKDEKRLDNFKMKKRINAYLNTTPARNLNRNQRRRKQKDIIDVSSSQDSRSEPLKMIEMARSVMRIACFATKLDDMYFWSHYGGSHKGYCLEYDFDDESYNRFLHPVAYTKEMLNFDINSNKQSIALSKSIDWIKEEEWRFIRGVISTHKDSKELIRKIPLGKINISAIYLGIDFYKKDNNNEPEIKRRRSRLLESFGDRSVFKMNLLDNEFGMKPHPIIIN